MTTVRGLVLEYAMLERIGRIVVRVGVAALLLWAVISVPLPLRDEQLIVLLRVPLAVFLFVVYVGKTLYDSFFFERRP